MLIDHENPPVKLYKLEDYISEKSKLFDFLMYEMEMNWKSIFVEENEVSMEVIEVGAKGHFYTKLFLRGTETPVYKDEESGCFYYKIPDFEAIGLSLFGRQDTIALLNAVRSKDNLS